LLDHPFLLLDHHRFLSFIQDTPLLRGRVFSSLLGLRPLSELFAMRGVPEAIRSDNGPEFVSAAIQEWLKRLKIEGLYIAPGSPWENGYAESFHSKLRDEFLGLEVFESVSAARTQTATWREDYNHHRPHSSLGYVTPAEYAARCAACARPTASLRPHSDLIQPVLS
jgi:putative transposase